MKPIRATLLGFVCAALAGPALAAESVESADSAASPGAGAVQPPAGETVVPAAEAQAIPLVNPPAAPSAAPPQASIEPTPAPLVVLPGRQGYAFEKPEILARQRIFGLAHGVSLLAAACLDLPAQASAIEEAYAAWHARQAAAIETVVHDLARHYFGPRFAEAQWPDLVKALGLKEDIGSALGEFTLEVACATLPQVLDKPRYDLAALLADPRLFDALPATTSPAPTMPAPAQTPPQPPSAGTAIPPAEPGPDAPAPAAGTVAVPPAFDVPAETFQSDPPAHD